MESPQHTKSVKGNWQSVNILAREQLEEMMDESREGWNDLLRLYSRHLAKELHHTGLQKGIHAHWKQRLSGVQNFIVSILALETYRTAIDLLQHIVRLQIHETVVLLGQIGENLQQIHLKEHIGILLGGELFHGPIQDECDPLQIVDRSLGNVDRQLIDATFDSVIAIPDGVLHGLANLRILEVSARHH